MNEPIYLDVEYESIRTIFNNRGAKANQLPRKTITFIPSDRADRVLALDQRIQVLQKWAPVILGTTLALVSFLLGTAV